MRRRECIASLGSAVVLGPPLAYGQSPSPAESTCRRVPISAVDLNPLAAGAGYSRMLSPVLGSSPYSAVETTKSITTLLDGNRIVRTYSARYFRDGQGRTREERGAGSPLRGRNEPTYIHVTITDPVNGKSYHLDPQEKHFASYPAPRIDVVQGPIAPPLHVIQLGSRTLAQVVDESVPLGEKIIEGLKAMGSRLDRTIDAGDIGNERPITVTSEQWFSPDLGVLVFAHQQSPVGTDITYRLEHIERAEPAPDLFVVPSDYKPYPKQPA